MLPPGELMLPWFSTLPPTNATSPPLPWITPWLATVAEPPADSNRSLPDRKSALLIASEEATNPAVSMVAPAPTVMPLGLIRNT